MPVDAALARRQSFYLKTDIVADDGALQQLPVSNRVEAARRSAELGAVVARELGVPAVAIMPLDQQGTFHLVHSCRLPDGNTLIVRSSLPVLFNADTSFYADQFIQEALPGAGLPGVAVQAVDCSASQLPYAWMVMDKAAGVSMAALSDAVLDAPMTMQQLGQAMAQLHGQARGKGYGPVDCAALAAGSDLSGVHVAWTDFAFCRWEEHCRSAVAAQLLQASEADVAWAFLREWETAMAVTEGALLHGDPGNPNFFMQDGRISALLDWEDAVIGDPLYDVAFWASFHPRRRWPGFFAGYGSAPVAGSAAAIRFAFYFLRITLAKVLHRQRFGYRDQPGRPSGRQRVVEAFSLLHAATMSADTNWLGVA